MNFDGAYPRESPKPKKRLQIVEAVLLALVIAFLLAEFFVPHVSSGHGTESKQSRAKADIAMICGLINQFKLDCGRYPTTIEGFQALKQRPAGLIEWHGPYLQQPIPPDRWDNPYCYTCPGPSGDGYQVVSYGADGQCGGTGDNADIVDGSDS